MNKLSMLALAAGLCVGPWAAAQQWISPQIGSGGQRVDAWVQPTAAYQPPGRAYAIDDRFPATAQLGAAPLSAGPVAGGVAVPAVPYNAQGLQQPGAFNTYAPPAGSGLGPITVAPGQVMHGGQVVGPFVGGAAACGPACGPVCPPGCPPSFGTMIDPYASSVGPTFAPPAVPVSGGWRRPYAEIEGRLGDEPETLQGNLFVPFLQKPNAFWFADIRGQFDDEQAAEGNWGLAYRRLYGDLIWGFYGFYDLRHTEFNNNFHGATFGLEALDINWEARFNWYIPEGGSKPIPGAAQASLLNNAVVVQQNVERAYYGFDGEVGRLIWRGGGLYDAEVRAFLGGFYFDTSAAGFRSFGGPRARIEGRLYDLPRLGPGSRLTFGGVLQYDDVRDLQGIASVNLRIPFGAGNATAGAKLSPMERRMLSPIRRDDDIVTATGLGAAEQAVLVGAGADGLVLANVTEVNSSTADVPATVAGGTPIVVVTEDVETTQTIVMNEGQFIGGRFAVRGQNTGTPATFGRQSRINATGVNALQIANNTQLVGLRVTGDSNGVIGGGDDTALPPDADALDDGVNGFTISNSVVSVTGGDAIRLEGVVEGNITGSTLTGSGRGLAIDTYAGGTIRGNTFAGSGSDGMFVGDEVRGGTITANTASGNGQEGFDFDAVTAGVISDNRAVNNGANGFEFDDGVAGGVISGNRSENSGGDGFVFQNGVTGGAISGNRAEGNANDGFAFGGTLSGGSIDGNVAIGNNTAEMGAGEGGFGGFNFFDPADNGPGGATVAGAAITNNHAENNGLDGFAFNDVTSGSIADNTATGNNTSGEGLGSFSFFDTTGGTVTRNTANGNSGDGFTFFNQVGAATISMNTAADNTIDGGAPASGFNFVGGDLSNLAVNGAAITGNTATGNKTDGFTFLGGVESATITANTAGGPGVSDGNGDQGFSFASIAGADAAAVTIDGNLAQGNASDGFDLGIVTGGTITNNTAGGDSAGEGNTESGFLMFLVNESAADAVVINDNTALGNQEDGFSVAAGFFAGDFQNNTANNNAMAGFDPVGSFLGDNAGNTASGNGTDNTAP